MKRWAQLRSHRSHNSSAIKKADATTKTMTLHHTVIFSIAAALLLLGSSSTSFFSSAFTHTCPQLLRQLRSATSSSSSSSLIIRKAAESEVSFGELDGSELRIGVLRTRWNDEHVSNLVEGIKVSFFSTILLVLFLPNFV